MFNVETLTIICACVLTWKCLMWDMSNGALIASRGLLWRPLMTWLKTSKNMGTSGCGLLCCSAFPVFDWSVWKKKLQKPRSAILRRDLNLGSPEYGAWVRLGRGWRSLCNRCKHFFRLKWLIFWKRSTSMGEQNGLFQLQEDCQGNTRSHGMHSNSVSGYTV